MSQQSKQELVKRLHPRYLQASRRKKTKILDEFTAVMGCHRKYAIRVLRKGVPSCPRERRGSTANLYRLNLAKLSPSAR